MPSTHKILFTQGGGTGQFSAVVMNMLARHALLYPNLGVAGAFPFELDGGMLTATPPLLLPLPTSNPYG